MKKNIALLVAFVALASSGLVAVACNDDTASTSSSSSGNPFNPPASEGGTSGSSGTSSGNPDGGADAACSKPVGCFCGTPTTQEEFLNRCTNAAALPVNLTVKPATTADIP